MEGIEQETEAIFNKGDADKKGYLEENQAKELLQVVLNKFDQSFSDLELAE